VLLAAPISAAGIASRGSSTTARSIAFGSLVAVPLVWALAWQGNMLPQWGGRLVLLAGATLTTAGVVAIERAGWRRGAAVLLVLVTLAIAALGGAWHIERTNAFAAAIADVESAPNDTVTIFTSGHFAREAGAWWGEHRWLRGDSPDDVRAAASIARRAGAPSLQVVDDPASETDARPPKLPGWRATGTGRLDLLGTPRIVHSYRRR
jgi:hypothetical protein